MKQQELIGLLTIREEMQKDLKKIRDLVVPEFIKKPIACKASEWNNYLSHKNEYDSAVYQKGEFLVNLKSEIKSNKLKIIEMLPSSNVWFITDDDMFAVGHRSNNWPSSDGDLLVVKNPIIEELKEIHHQVVN